VAKGYADTIHECYPTQPDNDVDGGLAVGRTRLRHMQPAAARPRQRPSSLAVEIKRCKNCDQHLVKFTVSRGLRTTWVEVIDAFRTLLPSQLARRKRTRPSERAHVDAPSEKMRLTRWPISLARPALAMAHTFKKKASAMTPWSCWTLGPLRLLFLSLLSVFPQSHCSNILLHLRFRVGIFHRLAVFLGPFGAISARFCAFSSITCSLPSNSMNAFSAPSPFRHGGANDARIAALRSRSAEPRYRKVW